MLKVAVIGLGDVSDIHLSAISENPGVSLVAVCDIDESLNGTVEGSKFYSDYHEMLEREKLDCVHICLPHHLHYEATKACVEKGIHVYLEKPLAENITAGESIVELEQKYKESKICISFQNRYNETVMKLQEIVSSGKYGSITGLKGMVAWHRPSSYYELKPWRGMMKYAGGGVMINQAIHTLDLMQLIGGKIDKVRGTVDKLMDYEVDIEDTVTANFVFSNGAKGLFFATNANVTDSSVELQVFCEHATFTIKDSILTMETANNIKEKIIEDKRLPGKKFYYGAGHEILINHFYSCIKSDSQNYISAQEALISLQIIDAIKKSSEMKKFVYMEDYKQLDALGTN